MATIASCVLAAWSSTCKHVVNLLTVIVSTEKQKMNDTINSLTETGRRRFHLVSMCVAMTTCGPEETFLPQSAYLVIHATLSQVFLCLSARCGHRACWAQLKTEGRYWEVMQIHENWPKASVFDDLRSGLSQLQSLLEGSLYSSFSHFS